MTSLSTTPVTGPIAAKFQSVGRAFFALQRAKKEHASAKKIAILEKTLLTAVR